MSTRFELPPGGELLVYKETSSSVKENTQDSYFVTGLNTLDDDIVNLYGVVGLDPYQSVTDMNYTSNRIVTDASSLKAAISALDAAVPLISEVMHLTATANGAGTIVATATTTTVTGTATTFTAADTGKFIKTAGGQIRKFTYVSATSGTVDTAWGTTETTVTYTLTEAAISSKTFLAPVYLPSAAPVHPQEAVNKGYVDVKATIILPGLLLGGRVVSNVSTPNTKVDFSPCIALDSTGTYIMQSIGTITKDFGSTWVVGSSNGGMDTGVLPTSGTIHFYEIERLDTGVVDFIGSTSATAPTLPANYTIFRRIGSWRTDASVHLIPMVQYGDRFEYITPPALDVSVSNQGTTAVTRTLSVPIGIQVEAIMNVVFANGSAGQVALYMRNMDLTDLAPSISATPLATLVTENNSATADYAAGVVKVMTNTSGQITTRATSTGLQLSIATIGWSDQRGRITA